MSDHGLLRSQFSGLCAILTDKGYQGAQDTFCVLVLKSKQPHRMLSIDQEQNKTKCLPTESLRKIMLGALRCCGKSLV